LLFFQILQGKTRATHRAKGTHYRATGAHLYGRSKLSPVTVGCILKVYKVKHEQPIEPKGPTAAVAPRPSLRGRRSALPKPYPNPTQTLPKPYPNLTQTIPKPYPNPTQTLPKPDPNPTQTLPKPYPNLSETLPKPYPNHTKTLPKPYPNPTHKIIIDLFV
jgi:hypothetical protein